MYDFLCLMPHATASHSLQHYLNLHKDIHVAHFLFIGGYQDRIDAHERNFRPHIQHLGLSSKVYHERPHVETILNSCSRKLIIQAVRDPVACLISQINNTQMVAGIYKIRGAEYDHASLDQQIEDAVTRYITHNAASQAYDVASFDEHILVDMTDLMPDTVDETLTKLWLSICGNADRDRLISDNYKTELGSKFARYLRDYGIVVFRDVGVELKLAARTDADLMIERYDPLTNTYTSDNICLHTFPDINEYLPSMQATGPFICALSKLNGPQFTPKSGRKYAAGASHYLRKI